MLLKSKISFTVLAIYEMLAVSVLHFQRLCDAMFPTQFCDSWYRYFLFCVIIPLLVFLVCLWIREIVVHHRRRKFIRRAKNTVRGVLTSIRGKVSEHLDIQDMEKIITAAVLVGVKRYADNHPNLRRNVNHIMDVADGTAELDLMEISDEVPASRTRTSGSRNRPSASSRRKK